MPKYYFTFEGGEGSTAIQLRNIAQN